MFWHTSAKLFIYQTTLVYVMRDFIKLSVPVKNRRGMTYSVRQRCSDIPRDIEQAICNQELLPAA